MPLATISLMKGTTTDHRQAISQGVHQALVEVVGIPQGDRFQLIHELDPDSIIYDPYYLDIERSDGIVFIQITLRKGRSRDIRVQLNRRIAEILSSTAGIRPEDVFVTLVENDYADWSVGNGDTPLMKLLDSQDEGAEPSAAKVD